jgi:SAM-dependent methyltransferase
MQAYGPGFARVYNTKWSNFALQVAPLIQAFYESTQNGKENKSLLDVCCGAGHLAVHFLEAGYSIVGIDLSEHMLHYAKENTARFVETGQAKFIRADASNFTLGDHFGLVVSTFDSLNHLESEQALADCFRCVYAVCDGYFIFDLNTRRGLRRWNSIYVNETSEDALIITRGICDEENNRAWTRITGFIETSDGLYERFDENAFNSIFDLDKVKAALLDVGFKQVHFAHVKELQTPIAEPEEEGRVFVVAKV